MSDGSSLHIYESICLEGQLRNVPFKCLISDDAILGTKFLSHQHFLVSFDKELLVMVDKVFYNID